MTLYEREPLLAQLGTELAAALRKPGRLVLVGGEAGIGKSSLVEAFCAASRDTVTVLWGNCDPVVPPRPFAPVGDIADAAGGELGAALAAADRDGVFDEFLNLLRRPRRSPPLVVFEDVHWADDATLDLLRVLGRRLQAMPALVVATYRDDEVGPAHPLRRALGDVPAALKSEVHVPALSLAAVAEMTKSSRRDPSEVFRSTRGNPFFVTEVVAATTNEVPPSVNDLLLARVARLSPAAQQVVRAASALGPRSEIAAVVEVGGSAAGLDECIAGGVLELDGEEVRFRHELAQRAVYESLGVEERAQHHRDALRALGGANTEPAVVAMHAVEARDEAAALTLSQAAGDRAERLGAHAEAVAHYATALRFVARLDDGQHAALLEKHAREAMLVDDVDAALASQRAALERRGRLGDARGEGECLRGLSEMLWFAGVTDAAMAAAQRAVDLLEATTPHGAELARAYASLAQRSMVAAHDEATVLERAGRALQLAEQVGEEQVAVHALTTIGVVSGYNGNALDDLERAVERALAAGLDADAARALINLVELGRDLRRYDLADRYEDEALRFLNDRNHDLGLLRRRLLGDIAELALDRGRWDRADELSSALVEEGSSSVPIRARALVVMGRLRARRGDGDPWAPLDDALELAVRQGELQEVCPVSYARAEAAWLDDDLARARNEAARGLDAVLPIPGEQFRLGEGAFWAWKAGGNGALPEGAAEPYVLHVSGRFAEAAAAWRSIGCPYEEALALADSTVESDLRAALELCLVLGAGALERRITARLRELGASGIPRGPRRSTRANPAGLTERELDVLHRLTRGLSNADIAASLVLSPKTVDHHVSSILRKLRVPNRAAAAERAASLGLEDRESEAGR